MTMAPVHLQAFPQPFARIQTNMEGNNSKAREIMNWLSYFAMEVRGSLQGEKLWAQSLWAMAGRQYLCLLG